MKVLVLGCGPAGLISAYAAQREFGAEVKIVSLPGKSELYGCQYLHEQIPGLSVPSELVTYRLNGDVEGYRSKVYGSLRVPAPVSPQQYEGTAMAWDIRATYDQLWEMFHEGIEPFGLTPMNIIDVLSDYNPDAVISGVPLPSICQSEQHAFSSVPVWAIGDAPEFGQYSPIKCEPFTVVCDGTPNWSWYRAANVFGYQTVEWPGSLRRVPIGGVVKVNKPLSTDCDCFQAILRVGRMGMWQKGVLAHQAYNATVRYLSLRRVTP